MKWFSVILLGFGIAHILAGLCFMFFTDRHGSSMGEPLIIGGGVFAVIGLSAYAKYGSRAGIGAESRHVVCGGCNSQIPAGAMWCPNCKAPPKK